MRKDRRLWWRILSGCLLTATVIAWAGIVCYVIAARGALLMTNGETVIRFQVVGGRVREWRESAEAALGRIRMTPEPGRFEVHVPCHSLPDYVLRKAYLDAAGRIHNAPSELLIGDDRTVRAVVNDLRRQRPDQADALEAASSAYDRWVLSADSRRLGDVLARWRAFAGKGKLEFRIAPTRPGVDNPGALDEPTHRAVIEQFAEVGPEPVADARFVWLPVDCSAPESNLSPNLVTVERDGRTYVLLSNTASAVMRHEPSEPPWSVEEARPSVDGMGKPAVDFTLDPRGARDMGLLTSTHREQHLAVLLDGQVFSTPIIQSTIFAKGQITGDFTRQQAGEIAQVLSFGSGRRPEGEVRLFDISLRPPSVLSGGYPQVGITWISMALALVFGAIWIGCVLTGRLHLAGMYSVLAIVATAGGLAPALTLCGIRTLLGGALLMFTLVSLAGVLWLIAALTRPPEIPRTDA